MKFEDIEVGDFLVNPFGFPMDDERRSDEIYYVDKREGDAVYTHKIIRPNVNFRDKDPFFDWEELRIVKSDEEKAFILLQLENYRHG